MQSIESDSSPIIVSNCMQQIMRTICFYMRSSTFMNRILQHRSTIMNSSTSWQTRYDEENFQIQWRRWLFLKFRSIPRIWPFKGKISLSFPNSDTRKIAQSVESDSSNRPFHLDSIAQSNPRVPFNWSIESIHFEAIWCKLRGLSYAYMFPYPLSPISHWRWWQVRWCQ